MTVLKIHKYKKSDFLTHETLDEHSATLAMPKSSDEMQTGRSDWGEWSSDKNTKWHQCLGTVQKIKYETLRGQKSFKKEEKKKSFQLLFAVSFFYYYYYSVQFFMSFDQQAEERNKSPSSLCTHSCALSACGWKRDESVNRGRFRCSHSLSEANSVAVITVNLLCHSAAISSHSFISFPILFTAPCSYLIRQPSRFHKSPFSALQEAKVALWAEGSVMASIRLRVKSQQDLLSFCYVAWSEAWDYVGQTFESESFPFFFFAGCHFCSVARQHLL